MSWPNASAAVFLLLSVVIGDEELPGGSDDGAQRCLRTVLSSSSAWVDVACGIAGNFNLSIVDVLAVFHLFVALPGMCVVVFMIDSSKVVLTTTANYNTYDLDLS